jgi:type IV pilus assembly protein PilM
MRFQLPKISVGGARTQAMPPTIVAIDMGTSRLKYLRMQRRSNRYVLTHFGWLPVKTGAAAVSGQTPQVEMAELVRACLAEIGLKRGHAVASISARSTLIRHVEFPQMPLEEMKKALKLNSSPYLHQQYTNYNFDCHIVPPKTPKPGETTKGAVKLQVLVGGASTQDVLLCRDALLGAGLIPMAINLAPIATLNAFESSYPALLRQESVALVDIGNENSVISIVDRGNPVLTRSVQFGGSHITSHIAKTLSVELPAAEEEKLKMSDAVQVLVASCLSVFARQLRSSIDFFERQNEVPVKRVLCSGGTAMSHVILQFLTDEIGLPCKSWDPTENVEVDLKGQKEETLKEQAPGLVVAVGTALGAI